MFTAMLTYIFTLLILFLHLHLLPGEAATFTLTNNCGYTVWPGFLSNAGVSQLSTTGISLQAGQSTSITTASDWAGRLWARTICTTNTTTGKFSCRTGDCGSGNISCSGAGAAPPATLAEFTLSGAGGLDFYDVSLVDGYNLPIMVVPRGGGGPNCTYTGCVSDLNGACPSQLRVTGEDSGSGGNTVACKSACDAFNSPQYCCIGAYGSPDTCKPSSYSEIFKKACPRAYSYAYDDKSSTFTCSGSPDYTISFCPSLSTSQKASSTGEQGPASTDLSSILNGSMVYEGASDESSSPYTRKQSQLMAGGFTILTTLWQLRQLY